MKPLNTLNPSLSRRTLVRAFPFIGAAAAVPVSVVTAARLITASESADLPSASAAELFEHHFAGLVAALNETSGECDGWNFQCGFHAADSDVLWHKARRFWNREELVGNRLLPGSRSREFDPLTGASTDWRDLGYRVSAPTDRRA